MATCRRSSEDWFKLLSAYNVNEVAAAAVYLCLAMRHFKSFPHFSPADFSIAEVVISVFVACFSMARKIYGWKGCDGEQIDRNWLFQSFEIRWNCEVLEENYLNDAKAILFLLWKITRPMSAQFSRWEIHVQHTSCQVYTCSCGVLVVFEWFLKMVNNNTMFDEVYCCTIGLGISCSGLFVDVTQVLERNRTNKCKSTTHSRYGKCK